MSAGGLKLPHYAGICIRKLKKRLGEISLANQLVFAVTMMMFCVITAVIGFTYNRTIRIITQQQAASNLEILNLKKSNFENYFSQLQDYSMLLRYNERLFNIATSEKPLEYTETTYINAALRDTFYSRNDIVSYKLYLLNSKTCYSISKSDFNIRNSSFESIKDIPLFQVTNTAKNYLYYRPETGHGKLMTICRVFINIINHRPLAFVEITVDDSFLKKLSGDSSGMASVLGVLDQDNQFYFSGNDNVLNRDNTAEFRYQGTGRQFFGKTEQPGVPDRLQRFGGRPVALSQPNSGGSAGENRGGNPQSEPFARGDCLSGFGWIDFCHDPGAASSASSACQANEKRGQGQL